MVIDFKKRILGLCLFSGMFFWFLDAILDSHLKKPHHTLYQSLLIDYPIHEFYERILVFIAFVLIGIIVCVYNSNLEKSSVRYKHLFSSINDAVFVVNFSGTNGNLLQICEVNNYASKMLGYQTVQLLGLSFQDILQHDGTAATSIQDALHRDEHVIVEAELLRKDGSTLIGEISMYRFDADKPGTLLIVRDITAKKKNEQALLESKRELQNLASQLLSAQEAERQRISIGLHDDLGQALMHLKFKIGSFIKEPRAGFQSPGASNDLLAGVDEIIEYVRRLSRELSPSVLEELGLTSSIHYLIEEFSMHYEMEFRSVELDQIDLMFPFDTELNIFRILQECLTNVARHAQATSVAIAAKIREDHVFFALEDNGKGFDAVEQTPLKGGESGIGISAMQQRVRMFAGSLDIQSARDEGTRVSFTVPFANGV